MEPTSELYSQALLLYDYLLTLDLEVALRLLRIPFSFTMLKSAFQVSKIWTYVQHPFRQPTTHCAKTPMERSQDPFFQQSLCRANLYFVSSIQ
jgi:hypothetical protein